MNAFDILFEVAMASIKDHLENLEYQIDLMGECVDDVEVIKRYNKRYIRSFVKAVEDKLTDIEDAFMGYQAIEEKMEIVSETTIET